MDSDRAVIVMILVSHWNSGLEVVMMWRFYVACCRCGLCIISRTRLRKRLRSLKRLGMVIFILMCWRKSISRLSIELSSNACKVGVPTIFLEKEEG